MDRKISVNDIMSKCFTLPLLGILILVVNPTGYLESKTSTGSTFWDAHILFLDLSLIVLRRERE